MTFFDFKASMMSSCLFLSTYTPLGSHPRPYSQEPPDIKLGHYHHIIPLKRDIFSPDLLLVPWHINRAYIIPPLKLPGLLPAHL